MKMVLKHLGRKELVETIEYPRLPDRTEKIMAQVLKPEELEALIRGAPSLQDRLIIELLDELGGRLGELYKLHIKDIGFEDLIDRSGKKRTTAIITLTGKTGTRPNRIYNCIPDLLAQINNNPEHDNADAPLLRLVSGKPMTGDAFYQRVRKMGLDVLKRKIHPHQFRHTTATRLSKGPYSDSILQKRFGWKTRGIIDVYSHISMKDVDQVELAQHGFKTDNEAPDAIMQPQVCPKCSALNAPVALYCHKCGIVLSSNVEITEEVAFKVFQNEPLLRRILELMQERNLRAGGENEK
jgi:integrase/ribosomal protein L40E